MQYSWCLVLDVQATAQLLQLLLQLPPLQPPLQLPPLLLVTQVGVLLSMATVTLIPFRIEASQGATERQVLIFGHMQLVEDRRPSCHFSRAILVELYRNMLFGTNLATLEAVAGACSGPAASATSAWQHGCGCFNWIMQCSTICIPFGSAAIIHLSSSEQVHRMVNFRRL